MGAPAPIYRSQGNQQFRSEQRNTALKRGQSVPYDVNGSPTAPAAEPGLLALYLANLDAADPAEPLYEFVVEGADIIFTGNSAITAGVAATGATVFPIKKNGAANGNITVTGSAGAFSISDSTYADGDLFSLYPPATADATLDRLRVSLEIA
jgi:hypothetical protein